MIHYSCDLCKRELYPDLGVRYVVKIEIAAAFDPVVPDDDDDRDHLQEIQDLLDQLDADEDIEMGEEVFQELRFDLCPECRRKFGKNPLGRETAKVLGFSEN